MNHTSLNTHQLRNRSFALIAILLLSITAYAQDITSLRAVLEDSGKYEFKLQAESDNPDYSRASRILSNQVKLDPKNAELRYFLGYAYDRMNSTSGDDIPVMTRELTERSSEQFEEVIRLQPKYLGEMVTLDPYTKITSIWGSLALKYMSYGKTDSANWAFREGRKRGGFIDAYLEYNRQMLNSCAKDAILVTYGDNVTFTSIYLQTVEKFRNDISIIDANLIATPWYSKLLKRDNKVDMSYDMDELDSLTYIEWETDTVGVVDPKDSTNSFKWELRPTYEDGYLLRSDQVLFNIFYVNYFKRPFYFDYGSDSSYNLFLSPYLSDEGLVDRVDFRKPPYKPTEHLNTYNIDKVKKEELERSPDAVRLLNTFRRAYIYGIYELLDQKETAKAKELFKTMRFKFPTSKLPIVSPRVQEYILDIEETFK